MMSDGLVEAALLAAEALKYDGTRLHANLHSPETVKALNDYLRLYKLWLNDLLPESCRLEV